MTAQLMLVYAPAAEGSQTWSAELDVLREAVALLGLKEVCHEVNRTLLCDAMAERDRKRWAAEWTHVIIAMLTRRADELAGDVLHALARARMGIAALDVVESLQLTHEEERVLAKLEEKRSKAAARSRGKAARA